MLKAAVIVTILSIFSFNTVKCSDTATLKELENFKSFPLMKKLEVQSQKTYSAFKDNFTKMFLKNEINKDKVSNSSTVFGINNAMKEQNDQMINQVNTLIKSSGPMEDPQIQFGRLAFLYVVMNRGDLSAANSIKRVCTFDALIEEKTNANLCGDYSEYLVKLIELRIGIISSRILYSYGVLGIPRGWYAHVQEMVKELEAAGMLSDSLKHLMILLTTVTKSNEEIDSRFVPQVLSPKSFANATESNQSGNSVAPTAVMQTNVTVDATHLTRQLTESMKQQQQQERTPQFDSALSRMLPNMLIL